MGLVAPIAAATSATLTVIYGIFSEGFPQPAQLIGFLFAFLAVWLLSRGDTSSPIRFRDFRLPLVAGAGFAVFYINRQCEQHLSYLDPVISPDYIGNFDSLHCPCNQGGAFASK